jgi:PKD repeat protein
MNTSKISTLLTIAVIVAFSACTVSKTPTPMLQGPSVLGLALNITASPDVLSMDGASQALIAIEARDSNGQPAPNVQLRAEIKANGQLVDFGSLSARTVITGNNGRATVTYTAPTGSQGAIPTLDIVVTPAGTDTNSGFPSAQFIAIRLVPPGVITGSGPNPSFTVTPPSPTAFTDALFDASASQPGLGASIVGYSWSFGDGSTATQVQATHRFAASGSYHVTLTVTDSNGAAASLSKDVAVGSGTASTANFVFSPTAPTTNQTINFNAGSSAPGAGHHLVRYDWDFGSGSNQSGVTVSKAYDVAGTYNVTLTTTDEVGQTALVVKAVTVVSAAGAGAPNAVFTVSTTTPAAGQVVQFNGSASTTAAGSSITNYAWDFGDGSTSSTNSGGTTTHTFAVAGTYVIRLTVTNSSGQTGTSSQNVTVTVSGSLVAQFTMSPTNPHIATSVNFNGSGSDPGPGGVITTYAWDFGDGSTSSGASATTTHAYGANFTYTIRLTVTDNQGRTATATNTLTVAP